MLGGSLIGQRDALKVEDPHPIDNMEVVAGHGDRLLWQENACEANRSTAQLRMSVGPVWMTSKWTRCSRRSTDLGTRHCSSRQARAIVQGVKDPLDRIRELEDHCEALENALAESTVTFERNRPCRP